VLQYRRARIFLFSKEKSSMSANSWFFTEFPPARSVIENDIRLAFWKSGYGKMYFVCVKDTAPLECTGEWGDTEFTIEWEPKNYLLLKMSAPNQKLLEAFENVLNHKALAAYKKDGQVMVEWRAKNAEPRFAELQTSGVTELERLNK
jgi:hypothetical protein